MVRYGTRKQMSRQQTNLTSALFKDGPVKGLIKSATTTSQFQHSVSTSSVRFGSWSDPHLMDHRPQRSHCRSSFLDRSECRTHAPLKSEQAGQTSPRLLSQLPLLYRRKLGANSDRLCQPHPQSNVYLIIQFLLLKLMATLLDVRLRAHERPPWKLIVRS